MNISFQKSNIILHYSKKMMTAAPAIVWNPKRDKTDTQIQTICTLDLNFESRYSRLLLQYNNDSINEPSHEKTNNVVFE